MKVTRIYNGDSLSDQIRVEKTLYKLGLIYSVEECIHNPNTCTIVYGQEVIVIDESADNFNRRVETEKLTNPDIEIY